MRKRLTTVGKSRAVILPKELLDLYGFTDDVDIQPTGGGLILRPAARHLTFEEAAGRLFAEKDTLLERLSNA